MPRSLRSLHPKEAVAQKAATPTLRSRKQQFVHDEIWGTAIDLFATRGFDATTVDDIARAAGVSRRSFFRYFSSKNDLMVQAIRTYGITLAEAVEQCPGEQSACDVLRYTVLVVAQQIAAHPRTRTIMEITAKSPAAREAQLSGFGELQDQVAQAFASRFKPSRRSDLSPQVFAALTQTLVDTTIHSWFYGDQPDISVTVKRVFTTVDHLLCKSSAR